MPVEMGDAATSIVDRLITPSGCLAKATGVIRGPRGFRSKGRGIRKPAVVQRRADRSAIEISPRGRAAFG